MRHGGIGHTLKLPTPPINANKSEVCVIKIQRINWSQSDTALSVRAHVYIKLFSDIDKCLMCEKCG